jgi:tRNA (cmo5U34)-methyltransferase
MKVGSNINAERSNWSFGGKTAEAFVEHAELSIPFYHVGHDLISNISEFFVNKNSVCYDLGVSTGELIKKMAEHHKIKSEVIWKGIDIEKNMTLAAQEHCKDFSNIEIINDNFILHDFEQSDFITSYYTMQFVLPRSRQEAFNKVYDSLNWGGAFILFEKVRGSDARFQDMTSMIYTDFKMKNGFSPEEIINKALSLVGVLEPFSTQGNIDMLKRAGFSDINTIFKWCNFEGFIAIK